MSLEEALAANTAALEEHNELLKKVLASGGGKAPEAKPAAKAEAAKPAAKAKPAPKGKKPVWDDPDTFLAAFGGFLDREGEKANRARLGAAVRKICDQIGVTRVSETPADQREEAYGYLEELIAAHDEDGVDGVEGHAFDFENPDAEEAEEESPL